MINKVINHAAVSIFRNGIFQSDAAKKQYHNNYVFKKKWHSETKPLELFANKSFISKK